MNPNASPWPWWRIRKAETTGEGPPRPGTPREHAISDYERCRKLIDRVLRDERRRLEQARRVLELEKAASLEALTRAYARIAEVEASVLASRKDEKV